MSAVIQERDKPSREEEHHAPNHRHKNYHRQTWFSHLEIELNRDLHIEDMLATPKRIIMASMEYGP